jgi:hypothetical protein
MAVGYKVLSAEALPDSWAFHFLTLAMSKT